MKKFLGILAIAGVLVACDNSGSTSASADSVKHDSVSSTTTTTTTEPTTTTTTTGTDSLRKDSVSTTTTTKDSVKH